MQKNIAIQMKKCVLFAFAGMLVTALLIMAFTLLYYYEMLNADNAEVMMFLSLLAGCVCSGRMACARVKEGRWKCALMCSCMIFAVIVFITLAMAGETIFSFKLLINALTIASGTFLGSVFCAKSNKRKHKRKSGYTRGNQRVG